MGDVNYCLVEEPAALVWLANLAAIELHPTLAAKPDLGSPTSVVFDLDPGPPADVLTCARVALLVRDVLAQLHLASWAKTSGSKGLQLYVPLNSGAHLRAHDAFRQGGGPVAGEAATPSWCVLPAASGPGGQGAHRLEPERRLQDHRVGLLAARPARAHRVHPCHLGRARGRPGRRASPGVSASNGPTCSTGSSGWRPDGRPPPPPARTASAGRLTGRAGREATEHGVRQRRPRRLGPWPERCPAQAGQGRPATGSTHRNEPDWPKWPKVAGELAAPVQCGDLCPRISGPRPQSHGSWRPKPGRTPSRPGQAGLVAALQVVTLTRVGETSSPASAEQVDQGPARPVGRRALEQGGAHAQGAQHARSEVVPEVKPRRASR